MAKTPKVKKREVSIHSRAARRNQSPPSKDIAVKSSRQEEDDNQEWMYRTQNAGITKKKKMPKQLTRQQKLRQQRGLENAERNIDKHEKKVADSKNRGRKVQARRKEWEELNEKLEGKENRTVKESAKEEAKEGAKEMEGVEMPDLEQPLPVRVAEPEDMETKEDEAQEGEGDEQPVTEERGMAHSKHAPPVEDIDEII